MKGKGCEVWGGWGGGVDGWDGWVDGRTWTSRIDWKEEE